MRGGLEPRTFARGLLQRGLPNLLERPAGRSLHGDGLALHPLLCSASFRGERRLRIG